MPLTTFRGIWGWPHDSEIDAAPNCEQICRYLDKAADLVSSQVCHSGCWERERTTKVACLVLGLVENNSRGRHQSSYERYRNTMRLGQAPAGYDLTNWPSRVYRFTWQGL